MRVRACVCGLACGALALTAVADGAPANEAAQRAALVGEVQLVSLNSTGEQADDSSELAGISRTGRYVAFTSNATNLVSGDTNHEWDVFLRDLATGLTERVSLSDADKQVRSWSGRASMAGSISGNGRYVIFISRASGLVAEDTNRRRDVFIRDRVTGTTRLVSVGTKEQQGDRDVDGAWISGNGHRACFQTQSSNLGGPKVRAKRLLLRDRRTGTTRLVAMAARECALSKAGRIVAFSTRKRLVARDRDRSTDIYVRDMLTRRLSLVTLTNSGRNVESFDGRPSISADGRFVAFSSPSRYTRNDAFDAGDDVFVRDLKRRTTVLASVDSFGDQNMSLSWRASISSTGRYVSFVSLGALVAEDTNNGRDIYIRDMVAGTTELVTVNSNVMEDLLSPSISGDGSKVAFVYDFDDLVPGDVNGRRDVFVAGIAHS